MNMWFGVVEERDDSTASDGLKLGRVRVRVFGHQSAELLPDNASGEGIPTADLFWAYPMMPINSASMNGIGESPTGIVEGTNVVGFSRDGEAMQDLVIIGTHGGVPKAVANTAKGFNDPKGVYPKEEFVGESDTNRLARNEKIDSTVVQTKLDSRTTEVPIALGGTWDEPINPYAAIYPFNHVKETESGHIHEYDDTPGAERTHRYHTTGTFEEIDKDGTQVEKIIKDHYQIILGDDYISVAGNVNVHVGGSNSIYVGGNANVDIKGNLTAEVVGDIDVQCANANIEAETLVHIKTDTFHVEASTKALFTTPLLEGTSEVKDGTRTMSGDRDIYNSHTHAVSGHNLATATGETQ